LFFGGAFAVVLQELQTLNLLPPPMTRTAATTTSTVVALSALSVIGILMLW
jgi:hypothetical protein